MSTNWQQWPAAFGYLCFSSSYHFETTKEWIHQCIWCSSELSSSWSTGLCVRALCINFDVCCCMIFQIAGRPLLQGLPRSHGESERDTQGELEGIDTGAICAVTWSTCIPFLVQLYSRTELALEMEQEECLLLGELSSPTHPSSTPHSPLPLPAPPPLLTHSLIPTSNIAC